jgi:hypothetical protein
MSEEPKYCEITLRVPVTSNSSEWKVKDSPEFWDWRDLLDEVYPVDVVACNWRELIGEVNGAS